MSGTMIILRSRIKIVPNGAAMSAFSPKTRAKTAPSAIAIKICQWSFIEGTEFNCRDNNGKGVQLMVVHRRIYIMKFRYNFINCGL